MNGWHGKQAGFRADLALRGAGVTLQGDAYEHPVDTPSGRRSGRQPAGALEQGARRRIVS
jgi:hypothetical protein